MDLHALTDSNQTNGATIFLPSIPVVPRRDEDPNHVPAVDVGPPIKTVPHGDPPSAGPVSSTPPPRKHRFGFGWVVRRLVALCLIGFALWWLVVPMLFPISNQAVVNARLVQVRAPIEGGVTEQHTDIGDHVTRDQQVMRFTNTRVDTTHIGTLITREAELQARKKRLTAELEELTRAEKQWRETADDFRQGRRLVLEAGIKEVNASLQMAKHQHESAKKSLDRVKSLANKDVGAANELDTAVEQESVSRKRIEREEATLAKAQVEFKAAQRDVYLQPETPYCLVRADELGQKLILAQSNLRETDEMLEAVTKELTTERERIAKLSATTATSPVEGVVWTRQGNVGQVVKQNEVVCEVADSSTIFVEALLHQRHLARVQVGCRATILLTGGETFTGHVRAVRTPVPADNEPSFALRLPQQDLKQVRVVVEFDPGEGNSHLIGRHARVLLMDAEPGPVQKSLAWLFCCVGG